MSEPRGPLAERVAGIARAAGREILDVYAQGASARTLKGDNSPLTAADLRSHRLIGSALAALTPGIPVLSEEAVQPPYAERARWTRHWLVDPLDGTREFLARNGGPHRRALRRICHRGPASRRARGPLGELT